MAKAKTYKTSQEFLAEARQKELHVNEQKMNGGWINSLAYNCTSTFLDENPEVSRKLTGVVYKRFKGLLWGNSKATFDSGEEYVSSTKLFKILPTKCKGNVILPKKAVMKNFKMEGLLPKS